jgi:uncharacterized protein (TIGR00645 family)
MKFIEKLIETTLFNSRWLLAPLYVGLVGALFVLLVKFIEKFIIIIPKIFSLTSPELVVSILGLVDLVLVANLLLMIIFSGYENFVSKIDAVEGHVDKPDWMGTIDYGGLKLKVIGSIVAISSIELLRAFINVQNSDIPKEDIATTVGWLVAIHLTFVISGLIFALTEQISEKSHHVTKKVEDKQEETH